MKIPLSVIQCGAGLRQAVALFLVNGLLAVFCVGAFAQGGWKDAPGDSSQASPSPLILPRPSNVEVVYELSDDGKGYYIYEKVGGRVVRPPSYISREEYQQMRDRESAKKNLRNMAGNSASATTPNDPFAPKLRVNSALFASIFGSNKVDIKPSVSVLLDFSVRTNRMQNPNLTQRQQKNTSFNFDQQIQMNVVGQIGEKLKLNVNYDTENTFNFENQFKINFGGGEDDIIQGLEAGNVSLPINGSLITGGQNLWGVKLATKFGPVLVTTVASQMRGQGNEITIKAGQQQTSFSKKVAEYDDNRHFFLNHYFRSIYESSLQKRPLITSPVNITRVEVWVTNRNSSQLINNRTGVGFVDLAENDTARGGVFYNPNYLQPGQQYPGNTANSLYPTLKSSEAQYRNNSTIQQNLQTGLGMRVGDDYEILQNMRLLNPSEYTLHPQLGFVSLNSKLQPNDVMFVAYEYTIAGVDGAFRVGEFTTDVPSDSSNQNVLWLKMVKPSSIRPGVSPTNPNGKPYPTWDLMMKNVYAIGATNLSPDGFICDIFYESIDGNGDLNYLPATDVKNKPLVQVFGLDTLINNSELGFDNRFDFLPGITVIPDKGLIRFPSLEPFGKHLVDKFVNNKEEDADIYAYEELYKFTQMDAIQYFPQQNRFKFKGSFSSKTVGSDIYLNAVQVAPGSISVTAGGTKLNEGTDYTVDYQVGKVNIMNPGVMASGQDIKIRFETNTLFGIEQKSMVGTRIDYKVNKDITLGGTFLHLNERPLIFKVQVGEEPVKNTIWGLDGSIRKESKFLTKLVDKLPFYSTKAPSSISFNGEFAQILPGHPSQIQSPTDPGGISYIDDFEGAKNMIDLTGNTFWKLSSRPLGVSSTGIGALSSSYNRAHLAWYFIDPLVFQSPGQFGFDANSPDLNNHYSRQVGPIEVFPNKTFQQGFNLMNTLDLHYFPKERGQYNFQADPAKINPDGTFKNPKENWAGITRRTTGNTDFEAANFEYIEFWVMDPFIDNPNHSGGDFYFNLGKVSEDVMTDNQRSQEAGLPVDETNYLNPSAAAVAETPWGRIPVRYSNQNAFDNATQGSRDFQDVGMDGVGARGETEQAFFDDYLQNIRSIVTDPVALERINKDPSSDDFVFFRDDIVQNEPLLRRYKYINGCEGNSPLQTGGAFSRQGSPYSDDEDVNADQQVSTVNAYFEYKVSLKPNMQIGQNYIIDKRVIQDGIIVGDEQNPNVNAEKPLYFKNKQKLNATWYQFRIPLRSGVPVGNIQDFKAIDFIRMYLTGWDEEVVLRFAKLDLVSTPWRPFRGYLGVEGETIDPDPGNDQLGDFEIGTVNIEENSAKKPFGYVSPPDIQRQRVPTALNQNLLQNEQSLVMRACNLRDGDARGVFKVLNYDLRNYKRLKMWVHGESRDANGPGNFKTCGDLTYFVRVGSDLTENYYEYEIPFCPSDPLGGNNESNIWQNNIDIPLELLNLAKVERNSAVQSGQASFTKEFVANPAPLGLTNGARVKVMGNPLLNNTKNIMVGVRNPPDNGKPVCTEVWVNEIRVTDFWEQPSWAANANLRLQLADLADVTLSGSRTNIGFGALDKKVNDRSLVDDTRYNIAVNLNAGKLLPEKAGIQIPVYFTYGEHFVSPRFDPLNQDVNFPISLEQKEADQKEQYKAQSIDYERNYSYSFNNVKKIKLNTKKKTRFYDLSNLAFTYSYSDRFKQNATIEKWHTQKYMGAISYAHNFNVKPVEPFGKLGKKKNLITSFNFTPLPRTVAFRIEGNRTFDERKDRSVSNIPGSQVVATPTIYNQDFQLSRVYNLQWDLTQSIRLTYQATNIGRVDEPRGLLNTQEKKDSLWNNFAHFGKNEEKGHDKYVNIGRNLTFNQSIDGTYQLPFSKVKPLNWISASATYKADFGWRTAALQNLSLGNTINNGRNMQGNASLNMTTLYKKFPKIEKILKPIPKKNLVSLADSTRKNGDELEVAAKRFGKMLFRWLISPQQINFNYTRTETTLLPGYLPVTDNFGLDFGYRNPETGSRSVAPGVDFIFGNQPELTPNGWFQKARNNGWLSNDPLMVQPFARTLNEQMTGRATLEPFKDFKIDVNVDRQFSRQYSGVIGFNDTLGVNTITNQAITGAFSMSFFSMGSAFDNPDKVFQRFSDNRRIISERLHNLNPNALTNEGTIESGRVATNGYYNGYTGSQQDVLIASFLSAYGSYKPNNMALTAFPAIPLPNWQVNYTGLGNLDGLKDIFKNITLKHGYRSSYSTNYLLNLNGLDNTPNDDFSSQTIQVDSGKVNGAQNVAILNYQPKYTIQTLSVTEQFAPLIGVNLTFKNGITATVDFKKSRNMVLNIGQLQLNESRNTEVTVNVSWRRDKTGNPLTLFGRTLPIKNTLTLRFEMTLRDAKTQNRRLDSELPPEPTGGNLNLIIKPSVDYQINTQVTVRAYFEYNRNQPALSTSFPTSYTAFGIQVRFNL